MSNLCFENIKINNDINILKYNKSIQNNEINFIQSNKICEEKKNEIRNEIKKLKYKKQRLINLINYISINLNNDNDNIIFKK